jgi:predicted DCC family thiol-disulfide oxidoreductase YuxK
MTERERVAIEGRALLLYDGVCALCNGLVRFLLKRDRKSRLRYTPLQSDLGGEILARFGILTPPDGIALVIDALTPGERLFQRSDAVQAALQLLGSPWHSLGKALRLVPRPLREFGYGIVARLRYRLFGRHDTCPLPPPEQRSLILGVYE